MWLARGDAVGKVGRMTAAWFWARAELRARWRSWVVLGLLAGATAGLVAAGVSGARRTEDAVPKYVSAAGAPIDAAVLPNDPNFDADQRADVAALAEVKRIYPFSVPYLLGTSNPPGLGSTLIPQTPATAVLNEPVIIEGRHTDPNNANEAVIDENAAERFDLKIGSIITAEQPVPPGIEDELPGLVPSGAQSFTETLRVVGITKSTGSEFAWSPSSGFFDEHEGDIIGPTNIFVGLRNGEADFVAFQQHVQEIVGHPVNVERGSELLGITKVISVTDVERDGLLLFALAALLGGGVLVGQALVRAVTASGADVETWRAMGADRPLAVRGMVLPALLTAAVGAVTAVVVAVAVSSAFPIGVARRFDLDVGLHADLPVLSVGVVTLVVAVALIAGAAAWWRVARGESTRSTTSTAARWATNAGLPPSLLIGSRLAVEPGRGRRAVPVRSALIGAIVGVLGVVGCFTFRNGINDAAQNPRRSGVVWDHVVAAGPAPVTTADRTTIADDPAVSAVTRALWARAVPVNDIPVSTFGIGTYKGSMSLIIVSGRAPRGTSEIAFGPTTVETLDLNVGDTVRVGTANLRMRVVGIALLPSSSHTGYDHGGWLTLPGMHAAIGADAVQRTPDDFEDYQLIRWKAGADIAAATNRMSELPNDYFSTPAELPTSVVDLGNLATMPLVLAVFFALLACATVAHALVTTVRRRRFDLAVLRSIGFTRRQSRIAIAWQATLLAGAGILVGVPLGLAVGRVVWRWVAEEFPVAYVPPIAVLVIVVVVPLALLIAQALAAGPAHAATRIHPAATLRTE